MRAHASHAKPRVPTSYQARPSQPCETRGCHIVPCQTSPAVQCQGLPHRAMPAATYAATPDHARPAGAGLANRGHTLPNQPLHAMRFRVEPGRAVPAVPSNPIHSGPRHACRSWSCRSMRCLPFPPCVVGPCLPCRRALTIRSQPGRACGPRPSDPIHTSLPFRVRGRRGRQRPAINQTIRKRPKPSPALFLLSGLPSPMPTCIPIRTIRFATSVSVNIPAS